MCKRNFILVTVSLFILISGCNDPYDFSKDFRLITISEAAGFNEIEMSGMGNLQLANGSFTDDYLILRKNSYSSMTAYFRLLYQRNTSSGNLNPKRLIFFIDQQSYVLNLLGSNSSGSYQWSWVTVEPSFLEKIAKAKQVRFRVEGSDKYIDYLFNERYKYCFRRYYNEYVSPDK